MKELITGFLNSPLGSFTKVLISVLLGHMLIEIQQGKTVMEIINKSNIDNYLTIAAASLLPVAINFLNGKDPRYGMKSKPKNFPGQTNQIKE